MAIMTTMIRLICCKVVWETLFCIGWKSAKMFIGGLLFFLSFCFEKNNFTTRTLSTQPIFGEGIG